MFNRQTLTYKEHETSLDSLFIFSSGDLVKMHGTRSTFSRTYRYQSSLKGEHL